METTVAGPETDMRLPAEIRFDNEHLITVVAVPGAESYTAVLVPFWQPKFSRIISPRAMVPRIWYVRPPVVCGILALSRRLRSEIRGLHCRLPYSEEEARKLLLRYELIRSAEGAH